MDRRLHMTLRIASVFLVFSGYLALASVIRYGWGFLFFPAVFLPAMPLGEWLERKSGRIRLLRKIVAIGWLIFIPFSLQLYGLLDAVIFLVIFIQFYLMTGGKSARIYYEIYLMAFFLLLAAVVQSPEPLIAVAFLLFGVSSVWAFSLVKMYHDQQSAPPSSLVELYRRGRHQARPQRGGLLDAGFMASMILLSFLSLFITIFSFLFTPRVEAGWLGRQEYRPAFTGISETVRIKGATSIYEDPTVVMHVRLPEESDRQNAQAGGMYWRITSLSRFFEDEWSRRGIRANYEPGVEESLSYRRMFAHAVGGREVSRKSLPRRKEVHQEIFMDEVPDQGVPVFDKARSLTVEDSASRSLVAWDGGEDFTISLQTSGSRRLQYRATSEVTPIEPRRLRAVEANYEHMDPRDYDLLTYQDLRPGTLEKVEELTRNADSIYDKIQSLNAWLSGAEFRYTLTLPPLPDEHGIDAFLMTFKEGHCELYATALALMIRSLGVPARVVSGYRGGDYSSADDAYLIRASMSHLWAEALFPDIGWIRFDPSPPSNDDLAAFGRIRMAWSLYLLRAKMFWFQDVVGFEGGWRLDQFSWPWKKGRPLQHEPESDPDVPESSEAPEIKQYFDSPLSYIYALIPLLTLMLLLVFLWRKWRKKEPFLLSPDQQRARQAWRHFLKAGQQSGIDVDNLSPEEVLSQLKGLSAVDFEAAEVFTRQYEAARFGKQPCPPSFRQQIKAIFSAFPTGRKS